MQSERALIKTSYVPLIKKYVKTPDDKQLQGKLINLLIKKPPRFLLLLKKNLSVKNWNLTNKLVDLNTKTNNKHLMPDGKVMDGTTHPK